MGEAARVIQMPQKAPSFMDAVKKTAKAEPKKTSKSKVQVLDPPDNIRAEVDEYIQAKEAEKMAKAQKEASEIIINDWVRPVQDEAGFRNDYQKSYKILGTGSNQVTYSTKNQFSINADDLPAIEEILGESFDSLINQEFKVQVKADVFENEKLQGELMELLGDRFADFFETTVKASVADDFDRKIFHVVPEEQIQELRLYCRQYKPSLR